MSKEQQFRLDDFRDGFRPDPSQVYIHDLPAHMKDPDYKYKRVAVSFRSKPWHIDDAIKKGWEFVVMEGKEKTSRLNSVTEKENVRQDPVRVVARDGAISYWMKIPKKRYQENKHQERLDREKTLKSSVDSKPTHKGVREIDKGIINPSLN